MKLYDNAVRRPSYLHLKLTGRPTQISAYKCKAPLYVKGGKSGEGLGRVVGLTDRCPMKQKIDLDYIYDSKKTSKMNSFAPRLLVFSPDNYIDRGLQATTTSSYPKKIGICRTW